MSWQLGPDTDRYSHPNVREAERKDWGGREKLADPQTSPWALDDRAPKWSLCGNLLAVREPLPVAYPAMLSEAFPSELGSF
jgi:hypothetical protein